MSFWLIWIDKDEDIWYNLGITYKETKMKRIAVKICAISVCLAVLCTAMTSCGIFFDDENNFVGLHNIIAAVCGE